MQTLGTETKELARARLSTFVPVFQVQIPLGLRSEGQVTLGCVTGEESQI